MKTRIDEYLAEFPKNKQESLIPILQGIQEQEGFLPEEAFVKVGQHLSIPTSKIFGVATFYNQFRLEPNGKYHIQVCRGTACHVLGSATVLEEMEKQLSTLV